MPSNQIRVAESDSGEIDVLKVETLRSAHELDRLKSRWKWLENQGNCTLFQSYELNRIAAEWFSPRESPHVVMVESDAGIAIIPAVRRERELGLIGETLFDYRDVLIAGEPKLLERAWHELARLGMPLQVTALRGHPVQARWQNLHPTEFCNAPTTRRCDLSAAEFVTAHPKAAKASRRLAREGLSLLRRERDLQPIAEWIYRHKAEWSGHSENLFRDSLRQDLMLYITSSGVCDCTIWSYETREGDVAAALVTFRHGQFRHLYTIHHDDRWDRFSPGQVMIFDVTRESLAEGLDVDFMTGEYPYKNRLATAMVPLFQVAAQPAQMAAWSESASGMVVPAA
jgi:CelD/BcsL family acetyltransferase involved in cellulose biosynthesis